MAGRGDRYGPAQPLARGDSRRPGHFAATLAALVRAGRQRLARRAGGAHAGQHHGRRLSRRGACQQSEHTQPRHPALRALLARRQLLMAKRTVELTVPEPRALTLDPRHTAIVVVDVEHEFLRPEGVRYLGPRAEHILAPMARLLDRARQAEVPI